MDAKNETQFRWPLVITLALVFMSIIIYRFFNTLSAINANTGETVVSSSYAPVAKEVNKPDSPQLEQKQDLSTPDTIDKIAPRIEAIFVNNNNESCIFIQGNIAREGDIVDGFRILKIYPDKVEFEKDGKTITGLFTHSKTGKT